MPIHDWTRAEPGSFHHMHNGWIGRLGDALNAGLLPEPYYAGAEQAAAGRVPDVLALERLDDPEFAPEEEGRDGTAAGSGSGVLLADAPPRVAVVQESPADLALLRKKNRLVVRHADGNRVVALLEIVSPGNKSSRQEMNALTKKVLLAFRHGVHVLLIDLLPPGPGDRGGLHDRVWRDFAGEGFDAPPDRPLTLAAYRCNGGVTAYVEPTAIGLPLAEMPLFFEPGRYVSVPLEQAYAATVAAMPRPWRRAIGG